MMLFSRFALTALVILQACQASRDRDRTEDEGALEPLGQGCDVTRYAGLLDRYKNLRYAGQGANGCVELAEDSLNGHTKVAIKFSKQPGKLAAWKDECSRSKLLHERACEKGGEALKLAERYLPMCLEVGGTNAAPYIVMHAAGGTGIVETRSKVPKDARASVFAQMVGALAAVHGVGLSHNDLHEQNVVILNRPGNLVAFIDFGEVVPLEKGYYLGGYKQDENLLAREAALLTECPTKYPFQAEKTTLKEEKDQRAERLFKCIEEAWGGAGGAGPDNEFFLAFKAVINEAWEHQNWPHIDGVHKTAVLDLYHTAFVQRSQPELQRLFPAACNAGDAGGRHINNLGLVDDAANEGFNTSAAPVYDAAVSNTTTVAAGTTKATDTVGGGVSATTNKGSADDAIDESTTAVAVVTTKASDTVGGGAPTATHKGSVDDATDKSTTAVAVGTTKATDTVTGGGSLTTTKGLMTSVSAMDDATDKITTAAAMGTSKATDAVSGGASTTAGKGSMTSASAAGDATDRITSAAAAGARKANSTTSTTTMSSGTGPSCHRAFLGAALLLAAALAQ